MRSARMLGLVALVAAVFGLSGGCPLVWWKTIEYPEPLPEPSWLLISDDFGDDVTGVSGIKVCDGETVTFTAQGSKDIDDFGWIIESGSSRQEQYGHDWSNTFQGDPGDELKITVRGYDRKDLVPRILVESSFVAVIADGDFCREPNDSHHKPNEPNEPNDCKPPILKVWIDGHNSEFECTADEDGKYLGHVLWSVTNAATLLASFEPKVDAFDGGQNLACPDGGAPVRLGVGSWKLVIKAISTCGKTTLVSLVVKVKAHPSHEPNEPNDTKLRIKEVILDPNGAVWVGDKTTFVIKYEGCGTIHHLLPTSTVVGGLDAPAGKTSVSLAYIWPFPANAPAFFWPDDRDTSADRISRSVVVKQPVPDS